MAQYIFVKIRQKSQSQETISNLEEICNILTPEKITGISKNYIAKWGSYSDTFYAIQNSEGVKTIENDTLLIGWVDQYDNIDSTINGSYAVIKNNNIKISFFCDQFGSRTLWYYVDEEKIIISTSQRAIVALKGSFNLNHEAISWYLSSGCQGPFISWDTNINQVLPNLDYIFDIKEWKLSKSKKYDFNKIKIKKVDEKNFINQYDEKIKKNIGSIINKGEKFLLPISGGLDSRLLLSLYNKTDTDKSISLINWGVKNNFFDDKKAANSIAKYYKYDFFNVFLPDEMSSFNYILDNFIQNSEGRIDHFNAFSDGFELWNNVCKEKFSFILRGDLPYPTGLHLNNMQARQKIGLERLSDYDIFSHPDLNYLKYLQSDCSLTKYSDETLIEWRDRLYVTWRIPLVLSAFTQLISAYCENRTPMMDWELFKNYMSLPDCSKGNKMHIYKLWHKYDKTDVSSNCQSSLKNMDEYFNNYDGILFLIKELKTLSNINFLNVDFIEKIISNLDGIKNKDIQKKIFLKKIKNILSTYMPQYIKFYLKSKRKMHISSITVAYRLILIDKIIKLYISDSESLQKVKD